MNVAYNTDCLVAMRQMPDKCFDLAVVDPPYYTNAYSIITPGGNLSTTGIECRKYDMPQWGSKLIRTTLMHRKNAF